MRFEIRSYYCKIRYDVEDERNLEDEWCGNILSALVRIELPAQGFIFTDRVSLEDLMRFHTDIQNLYRELQGNIRFPQTKGSALKLNVRVDKFGHLHWQANYHSHNQIKVLMEFHFTSDQSYLPELLEQIALIIQKFPFQSSPSACV